MDRDHEKVKDLIAPYVLGAVEPEEAPLIRAHILSCDECMAQADEMEAMAAKLSLAVDDEPLPVGFADRVLEAATGTEGVVSAPIRKRWWSPVSALAGAAALVVVAVMGASLLQTRSELVEKERVISALIQSEDGMALQGTEGVTARMVPSESGAYFVVSGLAEAPSDHTYQLWLLRDGQPTSAGVFDISDGIALLETDHDIAGFDAAAVTIEPTGGSSGPTTDPILISS